MSTRTFGLDDALHQYLLEVSVDEDPVARALRDRTATLEEHYMQISPEQGQFLKLLLKLMNAQQVIEVGTYTGYSALCMAQAVGPRGRVVCCDISEEWTAIGREFWEQAEVAERIDLRLAPALETLAQMRESGEAGRFDFAFIDADKGNYQAYYEHLLDLIRPGGVIAVDNTLWSGRVADPAEQESDTVAIREFNRMLAKDSRVMVSLVPIGDGLTLARKH
ncbi:MAG: class I SAM-dependent methyltransferase [Gammaproteobacteria bacterium]|nr:class I SAM-dependent methyltransferase [Gammaproteobacteria bacterium]MDE0301675.1 class I SAM-dependent methyltransferase [Gammaproteobacteria bacterium]MDE0611340.1 class I SAM-dependent methyltransferase [Gammaproteobacteria bacterium]